ncbi:MAG: zf-HC2 domain-containing protein [Sphaerobacter sp.]|nr:zf-HC2 domain-containing protein [Sphaerobacter sp.]
MSRQGCKSIRPLISAYMDGELMPDEVRRLLEHLAHCDECATLLREYQLLREQVRELLPPPPPPDDLAKQVWQQTVERGAPSRFHRWFGVSGSRVGLSAVGTFAVILIAAAFLLVRGYERNLTPAVTGPDATVIQQWPVQQPIEITFNKAMDPVSVQEHLRIIPLSEQERLPISWRGSKQLIIGASPTETVPLLPNTDYLITILPGARDAYGGALAKAWTLRLHTTPALAQGPDPTATPTTAPAPTATSTVPPTAEQSPSAPAVVASATQAGRDELPGTEPVQPDTPTQPGNGRGQPSPGTGTPGARQPSPTTSPAPATPATPTPPADTPTPQPTIPAPTATPTPVPVTGAFGSVYWAQESVRARLGAPDPRGAYSTSAAVLDFQRGTMYARFDTYQIYVLNNSTGTWSLEADTWTASDPAYGGPAPEPNLWVPSTRFGKLWTEHPAIRQQLGYATTDTAHEPMDGRIQEFANGLMLYSDQGFVYVLYFDAGSTTGGTWEIYPDTSGHGDLLTPTPAPQPAASEPPASPPAATPEEQPPGASPTP